MGANEVLTEKIGLSKTDTFGSVMARNRGVGPGFDILRIGLALIIFIGHAKWIAGSASLGATTLVALNPTATSAPLAATTEWVGWTLPFKLALVPAFFALSGFLVTGSAVRLQRTSTFLAHRSLRIFPALVVEVLLSGFILGALLTTLPLNEYFSSPVFHRYLGNMFGFVYYTLPGVFEQNAATHAVNVNLWTLPAELYCYVLCAVLMLTRLMYDRRAMLAVAVIATALLSTLHGMYGISMRAPYPTHVVFYYFLLGSVAYHWRDVIPARPVFFIPAAVITYFLLRQPSCIYLVAPLLTWCTMFVGMIKFPKLKLLSSGDYSYGLYLYGFPLCQALIATVPWFYGRPVPFIITCIAMTAMWAAFSWHFVEKHVLKLKHRLPPKWFPTMPRERVEASVAV